MLKNNLAKIGLIICLGVFSVSASASDHHRDHEKAKQALINGDVLSLQEVLDSISKSQQGKPIKIEFDDDDGRFLYEIKLLRDNGNVAKIKVDATNGKILKIKERTRK